MESEMDDLVKMLRDRHDYYLSGLTEKQNSLLPLAADEIESLRQQLTECERERDAWHTTADGYAQSLAVVMEERDDLKSLRLDLQMAVQKLAECERERNELKTWLEDQVCEAKDFAYKLEDKTKQLATVTAERDELVAALELIGDTACGEASHQFIALDALAKLSADKTGEGS